MHAVTRFYSGPEAVKLFDVLDAKKDSVEAAIREVPGFVAYTLFRTSDGGVSVTVCTDKAGADQSVERAREWVKENAGDVGVSPPAISEGEVILQLA